ncbi:guanine nucleotide exchange factor DBS isoform X6 [Labeo rohita]|uniref:guanine nucleotide exchange factor DBS isoform X6 n=1 Tax=Labeo rohita TaxID=84645 RepID=UPI0021E28AAB|nr:guanine nucleotide exchange factor DBS isoform X6 [Labeo rohita]
MDVQNEGKAVCIPLAEVEKYYRFSRCCHWLQNEIMQKESSPLFAADIITELKKQFAFLSGGRGQDGSPIIIFPEFPSFCEIGDQEFRNVLTYLTSIPSLSAAGVGFIVVIDRRRDRWTCLKGTLLRISGWFPANLRLVLVLRPSAILQRTLSDVFFKLQKDDFKVPVIMLSSLADLHSYIERSQLTQELGGSQYYCHKTWICHRTDLESFSSLVKRMAGRLQVFGRELAETELPNNLLTASNLLKAQTSRKDSFKEEMTGALSQGRKLLENIREPVRRDPDSSLNPDQLENLATVHRLLSQLNESSTTFDEFWIQHQNKLDLCLKLCQFEHNFQQLRKELEQATDTLNAFSDVGISPAQTEHLLQELTSHEKKFCEVLDRVRSVVAEGQCLIENSQNVDENVAVKCSELQRVRESLTQKLKDKRSMLTQAMELHKRLEMVCKWCDEGIYMLASQPLDKCQSQEGAESALSELECYLETANEKQQWEISTVWLEYENILNNELREQVKRAFEKKASLQGMFERRRVSLKKLAAKQTRPVQPVAPRPESLSSPAHREHENICISEDSDSRVSCKQVNSDQVDRSSRNPSEEEETLAVLRRHVMNELLETERAYVEELMCVLQGYAAEMDNPSMAPLIPAALQNKKDVLFGNMQEIYNFHKRIFLKELETYTDCPELVGRCFLDWMGELQIYEKYCHNKPRSESLWRQCSDCTFFQECQKKLEHKLGLDSYLLKPVQRITKYQLLLKEMIKYSKGCEGSVELQAALSSILGILKAVNDSMHLIAITGYEGNLGDLGRLLMQGSFSVWAEHKRGHVKVMELARFKPMQRHLFLHQKALLFCKRREESGEGYEKAPSYSFKQELSMAAIGITEHAKGDSKKFEIWSSSRDEVYTVQAASEEVKTIWVTEIRKLLTGQLEACKEASQQKAPEQFSSDTSSSNRLMRNDRSNLRSGGVEKPKTEEERSKELENILEPRTTGRAKGSSFSFETKPKRQDIRSDPTPLETGPHPNMGGVRWFSTSSLFQNRRRGTHTEYTRWTKGSLSLDASVEHDGYFSAEEQMTSDPEEEKEDKMCADELQSVRIEEEIQCSEETEDPEK